MSLPRLYLLLPESAPCNRWMRPTDSIIETNDVHDYLKKLSNLLDHLKYDEYEGYFDIENVINCLSHFEILEDYYPRPFTSVLRSLIIEFHNWRELKLQRDEKHYLIHHDRVLDHTFCECVENYNLDSPLPNAIINLNAHFLESSFIVNCEGQDLEVKSIESVADGAIWFAGNRVHKRNFQISEKHGENRNDIRIINGVSVYPFRSSLAIGASLLDYAIGLNKKEIFNFEEGKGYIVFKWEGNNPQNMYHGYHVEEDSREVPDVIKRDLMQRREGQ